MRLWISVVGKAIAGFSLLLSVSAARGGNIAVHASETLGQQAPAPVLVRFDGTYQWLSQLYYSGAERPRHPRSVVVLNFMALNCPPCRKELPIFLKVVRDAIEAGKINGTRIRFFAVSLDPLSAKEALRTFFEAFGINSDTETLLDPYRRAAARFGVEAIPRTIVISAHGRVTADITGLVEDYETILKQGIADAVKAGGAH